VSYVAKLMAKGRHKIAQKIGEEAVELALAAVDRDDEEIISESADVMFHMMVLWSQAGIAPQDVWNKLEQRKGISGITEKARRKDD